jgi:malate dehydrogenase (oxaloacetate-decarboxylating)
MRGADLFIGLSVGNLVSPAMIQSMGRDPLVFALANPDPEILPSVAKAAGAALVASGRFDYPNHCNNVLAFPALMRAALDTRAKEISREMCLAAARAIAGDLPAADRQIDRILPSPLSPTLYPAVAEATARAAVEAGLARRDPGIGWVYKNTERLRRLAHLRQESLPAFGYTLEV